MEQLKVLLQVPDWIQAGLQNGQFTRIGGVIQNADNGRVVMWLRGGQAANQLLQTGPLPLSLDQMFNLATPYLSAINLGVSVVGFALVLQQLGQLSNQVRALEKNVERVSIKLDDQCLAKLKAGINACRDAVVLQDPVLQRQMSASALLTLHEARQYFNQQVTRSAEAAESASAQYVAMAFTALTAEAQVYLQLDESNRAAQTLREGLDELRPGLTKLMGKVMSKRARYLRPVFSKQISLDFLTWLQNGINRIQQEPGQPADLITPSQLFDQVRNHIAEAFTSQDSWHEDIPTVLVDTSQVDDWYFLFVKTGKDIVKRRKLVERELPQGLARIAILIEAHDRLCAQVLQLEEMDRLGLPPSALEQLALTPDGEAAAILLAPQTPDLATAA